MGDEYRGWAANNFAANNSSRGHQKENDSMLTEAQIKHMVDRFLGWKLPVNFSPDDGISFEPIAGKDGPSPFRRMPVGTNLFSADQAEAMVRYMIEGMPAPH